MQSKSKIPALEENHLNKKFIKNNVEVPWPIRSNMYFDKNDKNRILGGSNSLIVTKATYDNFPKRSEVYLLTYRKKQMGIFALDTIRGDYKRPDNIYVLNITTLDYFIWRLQLAATKGEKIPREVLKAAEEIQGHRTYSQTTPQSISAQSSPLGSSPGSSKEITGEDMYLSEDEAVELYQRLLTQKPITKQAVKRSSEQQLQEPQEKRIRIERPSTTQSEFQQPSPQQQPNLYTTAQSQTMFPSSPEQNTIVDAIPLSPEEISVLSNFFVFSDNPFISSFNADIIPIITSSDQSEREDSEKQPGLK